MTQMYFPFAKAARARAFVRSRSTSAPKHFGSAWQASKFVSPRDCRPIGKAFNLFVGRPRNVARWKVVEAGGYRRTRCGGMASLVKLHPRSENESEVRSDLVAVAPSNPQKQCRAIGRTAGLFVRLLAQVNLN